MALHGTLDITCSEIIVGLSCGVRVCVVRRGVEFLYIHDGVCVIILRYS